MVVAAPKKGDIYIIDFGAAAKGIDKIRPGVVVSVEIANRFAFHVTAAPIRSAQGKRVLKVHAFIPAGEAGLVKDSLADVGLVVAVAKDRVGRLIGRLGPESMDRLDVALRFYFDLETYRTE